MKKYEFQLYATVKHDDRWRPSEEVDRESTRYIGIGKIKSTGCNMTVLRPDGDLNHNASQ